MFTYVKILLWIFHVFYKHITSYYLRMNGYDIKNIYVMDCISGCVSDQLLIERDYIFCRSLYICFVVKKNMHTVTTNITIYVTLHLVDLLYMG